MGSLNNLHIVTWNANGLALRVNELEMFLNSNQIDIALISETHFTNKSHVRIRGFRAYWTTHPSGRAQGGSAILIKQNIQHFQLEEVREDFIQATIISLKQSGANLNIAAAYCPPAHKIEKKQFMDVFAKLGPQFVIAGDFNVKHTAWGSRLITPKKGNELLRAINESSSHYHSSRKPTYWPTDPTKIPDLLDFFITKGLADNYIKIEGMDELTSDHTPVVMTLSSEVIMKKKKVKLATKYTDWDKFRESVENSVDLKVWLKNVQELEKQATLFVEKVREAAREATPKMTSNEYEYPVSYPSEIRKLVKERRKLRRT